MVYILPKNEIPPKKDEKRINWIYVEKELADIFHLVLFIILVPLSFMGYPFIKEFPVVSDSMWTNTLTTNGWR